MLKRSFVSISFASDKLQVVQLSGSRKGVSKKMSVDLPAGVITNHRVNNGSALSKIMSEVWKKLSIGEKFVGIVVPEFSTYSKLIRLPSLTVTEINEALMWEAQEFLPEPDEMILDWRIAEKLDKGYEVLATAIDKKTLDGYVKCVEAAGLFPQVVETPSLALTRLTEKDPVGKLCVYSNFGETVLVVSQKDKVYGATIESMAGDEIISTAKRMISHFSAANIEKIVVGGVDITEGFLEKLTASTKKRVEPLTIKLSGLTPQEVQQFLIPIMLGFKNPAEPKDPTTINLLPSELVEKYKIEKSRVEVWSLILTSTVFIWISFLIALGAYFYLIQIKRDYELDVTANSQIANRRKEITQNVNDINAVSTKVLKIAEISVTPQVILNLINQSRPVGVQITSYLADLDKGTIDIEGISPSRSDLVTFKQNLEKDTNVANVSIPISSFEVETNLEYKMSFEYKPLTQKIKK
jgi:type IV pilus assembly protein PilM